jgi:hypothetical protein
MASENDYSGANAHVVLPVLHPSGETHNIAFPENMALPEMHDVLLDHGYSHPAFHNPPYLGANVDAFGRPKAGPSRFGVMENDPKFKAAAKAIYEASGRFQSSGESGTYMDENLERSPIASSNDEGHMTLKIPKTGVAATLHTHPNHFKGQLAGGQPSDTDIATAKKLNGPPVFVVSKNGLQSVDKFGKVTNVYSASDWYDRDNK